jgi:hypothetical protein
MYFNALDTIQAFEAGSARRKEREREVQMKDFGNALAQGNYDSAASLGFQIDPALGMQARQYGEGQNALALNKQIAPLMAAGKYDEATTLAAPSGNLELMAQLNQFKQTATEQQRLEAARRAESFAKVAINYQGMSPEQAAQRWQQDMPALQAQGFSPEELAQFDPTDPNDINDALFAAQTLGDIMTGRRADAAAKTEAERWTKDYNLRLRGVQIAEDEAEAATAEREAKAAASPEINVDDEASFRREYNSITSGFRDVQASYGRIKATDATTPAGQLSLVYQYMKMLDPGSTVMQGEQASAANARGVPEATRNLYNQIVLGKPLSAAQVADFTNQADRLYARSLEDYDQARTTYEGLAGMYGFDPERTVPDLATGRTTGTVFQGGAVNRIPQPAVQELLSDPSPEAMREFDEVFGRGQAQKIMQQQGRAPSRITF